MKFSELFTKTRKEAPKDEVAKNAELLIRAGFIHKEMAGVYSLLPLGLRVVNKINQIIREEMNAIGGQELVMTALQNPEVWKASDRWEQEVWFKTSLTAGGEVGLGWTQEETIARIVSHYVDSYRDLPFAAYQIQSKFRNEERAKSGILRGREFLMKDLYSFHATEESLDEYYEEVKLAYAKVFNRVGIGEHTFLTFASGGEFAHFSHEFQTLSSAGEDTIHLSRKKKIAINEEVFSDEVLSEVGLSKDELETQTAIEVGNIFKLGTRFSEALGLSYKDESGKEKPVVMGSYGIGPSRLVGTVAEVLSDEKGLVWPEAVAPFSYHLIALSNSTEVKKEADEVYKKLRAAGKEVLYDDRGVSAGVAFADAELIGIPNQLIVSEKTRAAGRGTLERKSRAGGTSQNISLDSLLKTP